MVEAGCENTAKRAIFAATKNTPRMDDISIEESISRYGYAVFDCVSHDTLKALSMAKYSTVLLCTCGKAVVELEHGVSEYELGEAWCVVLPPAMIVRLHSVSDDFKATVLQASQEITLSSFIGLETEMFNIIYRKPCFSISGESELTLVHNMIENLRIFTQLPESTHTKDFVCGTIHCLYIAIYDLRLRTSSPGTQRNVVYSSADTYFRQFVQLVKEHCRVHHDVAFYADKLHITPKYLNEISRKKVHFTAKEVITQFLVTLIKRELVISGNSVQRIAYDYNFCDQSSLGKFFKKATGMSPVAYRRTR